MLPMLVTLHQIIYTAVQVDNHAKEGIEEKIQNPSISKSDENDNVEKRIAASRSDNPDPMKPLCRWQKNQVAR